MKGTGKSEIHFCESESDLPTDMDEFEVQIMEIFSVIETCVLCVENVLKMESFGTAGLSGRAV